MDDRNDPGHDNSTAAESSNVGTSTTRTRIGLDVGTSKVVTARGDAKRSDSGTQLNAFFVVPHSSLHESTLQSNRVPFFREGDELVVREAMQLERSLTAPRAGTVASVSTKVGDFVEADAVLVRLGEPA
jgi:acetyl/propionyl-CoA carboxylase alpha subunit